jgi:hypothetical protein
VTTAVALLTVAEIAQTYGVRPGHIHVLAHRKHWRRIKLHGRVYYDLADVDKALGQDSPSA